MTIHFFVQFVYKQGTFFRYHNWALGLAKLGHTVRVYGASYGKGEKDRVEIIDGIEYDITACYFPLQTYFGQTTHPYAAWKRSRKKYPECDVAHVFQPHSSAFIPWYKHRKKAKLNIYDWDDLWTDGLFGKAKGFFANRGYRQVKRIEQIGPKTADITTTCSQYLADRAKMFGGKNVKIVYNGFWKYTPHQKKESRRNRGLTENAFYLGFMGRTAHASEMTGCFDLLEKAAALIPDIRLAMCGMPESVFVGVDEKIMQKVDYLGFLKPEETKDFASALDIGMLPLENNILNKSRFPIKFAEYLAAGTPVLCSEVGECAAIAADFSFVMLAGKDMKQWLKKGIELISSLALGQWPEVDSGLIAKVLEWNNISVELEKIYQEGLGS